MAKSNEPKAKNTLAPRYKALLPNDTNAINTNIRKNMATTTMATAATTKTCDISDTSSTNYYRLFNEASASTSGSMYNLDGFMENAENANANCQDGLYDYLKYLNDISFSSTTSSSYSSSSSSSSPSPPPTYQSIQYTTATATASDVASTKFLPSTATNSRTEAKNNINFNYTNNQVHYHIYEMNGFSDIAIPTKLTTTSFVAAFNSQRKNKI